MRSFLLEKQGEQKGGYASLTVFSMVVFFKMVRFSGKGVRRTTSQHE